MYPTKLQINRKNKLVYKDKFGNPISYSKCKCLKNNKYFLSIWSKKQYIFGKHDIWFSKDGDTLVLEFEEGNMAFAFSNKRFWLLKDTILEQKVKEAFKAEFPDVIDVTFKDDNLIATFTTEEIKYQYVEDVHIRFKESSKRSLNNINQEEDHNEEKKETMSQLQINKNQESFMQEEPDTNVVKCDRDCYFQVGGICKYFDWELFEATGEIPDCGEPFLYFETLA